MNAKSTPISVRITPRDAEFIAELNIDEAITPSDKIRALLKEAREKRDSLKDLSTCFGFARKTLGLLLDRIREEEIKQQKYSELISCFGDWFTDLLVYMASLECEVKENKIDLASVEIEFAQRIFRLCNSIVRMGVTQNAPCYDPEIISKRLPPLVEIISIIKNHQGNQGVKS